MSKKKIEPTEAIVEAGASYAWEETNPGILGWNSISEHHKEGCRRDARSVGSPQPPRRGRAVRGRGRPPRRPRAGLGPGDPLDR